MGPLMSAAASLAARKVLTSIIGAAVQSAAVDPSPAAAAINPVNARGIEKALVEAGAANPVLVNAVNAEPKWRSRIVIGNTIAAASPVIGLVLGRKFGAADQMVATIVIWLAAQGLGLALSFIGRLVPGLKPLFSRFLD